MNDASKGVTYDAIAVGDVASFEITITNALVREFANFSGDRNPLHVDPEYAKDTPFKGIVAHGMLVGAFFSRLIGMHMPGKYSLYLSQTLRFHGPITLGTEIVIRGVVTHKSDAHKTVVVATSAENRVTKKLLVDGEAMVQLLQ